MSSPKKKILVIDDDEMVFLYLRKKLSHLYELITTTEPACALDLALRETPDLILCDIGMPELNGGDMSGVFFECEGTRQIPFSFLTSIVSPGEVKDFSGRIGRRYAIAKATPVPEMIEMIEQMLRQQLTLKMMTAKKKILVIDDDEAVFGYLQQKLGHRYDLVTTTEPGLAVDLAVRETPDLILCDIDMPEINGGELSCRFFACEYARKIPFAYLTSFVSPNDVLGRYGSADVRRSIAKATPAPEMIRMIEQML